MTSLKHLNGSRIFSQECVSSLRSQASISPFYTCLLICPFSFCLQQHMVLRWMLAPSASRTMKPNHHSLFFFHKLPSLGYPVIIVENQLRHPTLLIWILWFACVVRDEILEDTRPDSLLPGQQEKGGIVLHSRPLVRKVRAGAKIPRTAHELGRGAWGPAFRHQEAVNTMTSFRAEWLLIW